MRLVGVLNIIIIGLFILAFIIFLFGVIDSKEKVTQTSKKRVHIFDSPWANRLQEWSYQKPFTYFIDEKEEDKQTLKTKEMIAKGNLGHLFSYRSYTTLKVFLFFIVTIILLIGLYFLSNPSFFLMKIMGIQVEADEVMAIDNKVKLVFVSVLLIIGLVPNLYIKNRMKRYQYFHVKDIPVIQLFIILMLRSNKTVEEVLSSLAKMQTRYKEAFSNGYRIYLRNPEEGLLYISDSLGTSLFKETVTVLINYSDYNPSDSIKILENNMTQIREKNSTQRKRSDLFSQVMSQTTLVVPMLAVILLGLLPFAVYGLEMFSSALDGAW